MTTVHASDGNEATDWPAGTRDPECLVRSEDRIYPVAETIEQFSRYADQVIDHGGSSFTNLTLGTKRTPGDVYYIDGDFSANNISGYGVVAIGGDLTPGGNISGRGIIIASGKIILQGGGSQDIYGAVIAARVTVINGQPTLYYDCEAVARLQGKHNNYQLMLWSVETA